MKETTFRGVTYPAIAIPINRDSDVLKIVCPRNHAILCNLNDYLANKCATCAGNIKR